MIEIRDLAAKLRGYWLRDLGIAAASADGTAEDGAIILGRTVYIPAAGGLVGINQIPTAPYALDIDGQVRIAGDLLPMAGNSWDIGATDAVFGAVYAAELHTHNLVAETKTATIGGRILVAPSTKLISALGVGIPYIDVAANVLTVGDRCYLESAGVVEWLAITSYEGTVTGGFRFNVTRYLSGGAASWAAGTALVNSGQAGAGYIDIYSRYGIPGPGETATTRVGPALSGNTRTGAAWDATAPRWVLGNLKGLYGYAADTYGLAAGDYSATWVAVDATNGFRLMSGAGTVLGQWTAAGGITVGEVAAAKSNIAITAGALKVRSNATDRIALTAAGVLTINDSAGAAVFTFDAATGAEFTKPLTLGAAGGIYQGSGTFSAPTTGLKIWNSAGVGKIAGINTGVEQWYGDTDGLFYAGAGGVILSAAGVTLGETGTKPGAVIAWDYGSGTVAQISVTQGGIDYLTIRAYSLGYPPYGSVRISGYVVYIRNDGNTLPGDLDLSTCYFNGATSGSTRLKAAAVAAGVVTLPAVTGTLALTSDVTAAVVGTSGKLAKFTGTNAVGNSIVTESGAAIGVAGALTVTGQADSKQAIVKNFPIASGAITPTAIAGLQVWLKADAITGKADGDSLAFWVDSSGYGRNFTQYQAAKQPTYKTAIVNSLPVVRHTAAGLQTLESYYSVGDSCTIFLVSAMRAAGTYRRALSGRSNNWLLGYYGGFEGSGNFSGWVYNSAVAATTNWRIFAGSIGATNSEMRKDGTSLATNAGGVTGPVGLTTNDGVNQAEYSDVDIAEIIVFNRVLTAEQIKGVEKYLANKYAITIAHSGGTNEQTAANSEFQNSAGAAVAAINSDGAAVVPAVKLVGARSDFMIIRQNVAGVTEFSGYTPANQGFDFGNAVIRLRQEHVPAAPVLADSGVAGNPNGAYRYAVAFGTAQGNTGYPSYSATITVTSKQVTITNIPLGTPGITTARHLYRTIAGGNTYKFLTTINDNTTTTYTDNIADGSLGGTIQFYNATGAEFRTGRIGETAVMRFHPSGTVWVGGLAIGSGTIPGSYLAIPYNQNMVSMNAAGDGFINILGVGASGISFGSGFAMGNQGITAVYLLSFYATGRINTSSGGGNYDLEFNNSAGGNGNLKWFGGSGTYHLNILSNSGGGYAGFGSNLTPTSRVHIAGSFARTGASKSANFTVDAAAAVYYVTTGSGADITATLVAASTCDGREYIFIKVDAGSKNIVITRAGADTINGATTYTVTGQYGRVVIKADGPNNVWYVVSA